MMKRINYILLMLLLLLPVVSCSSDDVPEVEMVSIAYSISNFSVDEATTRATEVAGSTAEQQIDNLYLFLFDTNGANPKKQYISAASFTGGTWDAANGRVTLNLSQAEVGTRQVYVIANVSATLRTTLDGVTTLTELRAAAVTSNTPWSPTLTTPILMSGNATHNFVANPILSSVSLIRALAKIELNITLPVEHQDAIATKYKFQLKDLDKKTYVLNPTAKPNDLVSFPTTGWQNWEQAGVFSSYVIVSGKVTTLKIVTYLNERDIAGSYINIQLPYNPGGLMPPPEFEDDIFKMLLPETILRNHWYQYTISL